MERVKRAVCLVLCFVMVLGLLPMHAFAATADDSLTAALTEATDYIDALTVDNASNDPATVVSNFGTHFTWDNEKRESNTKVTYLYDWSYYNGVVFEGLEYLYEVTGNKEYKDYVVEYMSSLITADGEWATCANNSAKTAAGYVDYHGADCYKTASLLLDAYEMTGDKRYLEIADELYEDLDDAASFYSLADAGNNYRHTWESDPSPDLWLDGLYMILPFRAEYAAYLGDTDELDLIVDRLQWVSDNMYDQETGLFYHAADNAEENSGTYWLRAIGWYAAAIVDVMDSMEGKNLEAMKAQLVKLVDGMWDCQNAENGMWRNNVLSAASSTNPYETSGTALVAYAVMKAVNNGWLDETYADMAIASFEGICNEKLNGTVLTDICFKGVPGSGNEKFYDNEGKGVGPFIMLTAEVQEYVNKLSAEPNPSEPEEVVLSDIRVTYTRETLLGEELNLTVYAVYSDGSTVQLNDGDYTVKGYNPGQTGAQGIVVTYDDFSYGFNVFTSETGVAVVADGMNSLDVTDVTSDEAVVSAMNAVNTDGFVAYNITPNAYSTAKSDAVVSIPVPADWNVGKLVVYYIDENGVIAETIPAEYANGKAVFTTNHFSTYALANEPAPAAETGSVSGTGNLVGGKVYTLDTDGVTAGKNYLIVNTASSTTGYALTNNGGTAGRTPVTISGSGTNRTITVEDDTNIAWQFSDNESGSVGNNGRYVYPNNGSLSLNTSGTNLTISSQGDGAYRIYRYADYSYYFLRYNNSTWTGSRTYRTNSIGSVYLYEQTSSGSGEAVTFTVTPANATIAPDGKVTLTGTVTVGGEKVDLSACTITWGGSNDYATVDDGTVTGVADGTANITATLSAVNGTALQENIVLTIPVTVQSKTIVEGSEKLTGNDPITTKLNVEPDFSNIKLTVTYDDGTSAVITAENGLVFTDYVIDTIGFSYAKISYAGKEYGTVRVTVSGNPYEGLEDATNYPVYPADGAVRIDKTAKEIDFATTGLVEVELDVAGVSVKSAVDVILVADISNSMAWKAGSKNVSPGNGETTKWQDLQTAAGSFIDTLLKANDDGSATANTVSFVMFGGYDAERNNNSSSYSGYFDATQTVFTGLSNAETAKSQINAYDIQGTDSSGYTMTVNGQSVGTPQGGTNYDHAFQETASAINRLKAEYAASHNGASYDESGRQIYVVFMTDGAPDHYNQLYYKTRSNSQFDYYAVYKNDTDTIGNYFDVDGHALPTFNTFTQYQKPNGYYAAGVSNENWIQWIQSDSLYAAEQVLAMESVNSITSIGFDLENGAFSTWTFGVDVLEDVLTNLAGENSCEVFTTADKTQLDNFYKELATKIRFAGTQAHVYDVIDSDFTLQMGNSTGTEGKGIGVVDVSAYNPCITIKTYDLWTKDETDDITKIGTRKGTSQVIETVTFNADGTSATSNKKSGNILSVVDGTTIIDAWFFTYTKTPEGVESFEWKIGNITDKEIALSYFAYLKGSLEGEEANGLKYTNEEATLEYIDINGKHATQIFPVPAVAWGGASTAYEFYLVNEDGKPCDRQGNEIPFANRIIITGPFYQDLYLNQSDEEIAQEIIAVKVLPAGYTLYDNTAKYTVQTASGNNQGSLVISDPAAGKAQTTIEVSSIKPSYIQSRVAFGVMYNLIPEDADFLLAPDKVVIDYGKEIVIDVNANNENIPDTWDVELIGFSMFYDSVDVTQKFDDTPYSTPFEATYGTFTLNADKTVTYAPHKLVNNVGKIFCVYKVTNKQNASDFYYMVTELDVIPATIMYYETDFADGVFTYSKDWSDAKTESPAADGPQDRGTIGVGQTYGYDDSYTDDSTLSNGSSEFALGAGVDTTTVSFSFTGTGFDLISRTGAAQGLIRVQVATDAKMSNIVKTVSVLNKSESNLELYQIPVVSINGLDHGTYYVKIGVNDAYSSTFIPALNRGNEFYFDAIRIYDPAQGNEIAEAAYNADGEANNVIDEVRQKLIEAATFDALESGESAYGMVFVDSTYTGDNADHVTGNVNIVDYAVVGPNNEVYLSNGQAVAFKIKANSIPASFDIGAKSITGAAAGLQVTIRNANGTKSWTVTKEIGSNTVQFIDLLKATSGTADASLLFSNDAYVVITNTAGGVLSITDIKTAYSINAASEVNTASVKDPNGVALASVMAAQSYDPYDVSFTVDANTKTVARSVLFSLDKPQNPQEPETPEEPEVDPSVYNILDASVKVNGSMKNRKYTITVVTSQEVEDVAVYQGTEEIQPFKISYKDKNKDGTRIWTIVLTTGISERYDSFTLIGIGENDVQGESLSVKKPR